MPPYGIAQFYDQIYGDLVEQINQGPKNIDVPMTLDETMYGSLLNNISSTPIEMGFINQLPEPKGIMSPSLGIDTSFGVANEADEDQVDYLGLKPNKLQQGLSSIANIYQRFSPIGMIARGLNAIRDRIDTNRAIAEDVSRDTQGTINTVVSPRIMNIQPTNQDIGRGGGTRSAGSKEAGTRSARGANFGGRFHG